MARLRNVPPRSDAARHHGTCRRVAMPQGTMATGRRRQAAAPTLASGGGTNACDELIQPYRRIRQACDVDPGTCQASPRKRLDLVIDIPDVDVHAGEHSIPRHPEGDEFRVGVAAYRRIAAEDDAVVPAWRAPPRVLHADAGPRLVLVGEEVRHPVVDNVAAQHREGRGRATVQYVGPVLDAEAVAEARVMR